MVGKPDRDAARRSLGNKVPPVQVRVWQDVGFRRLRFW
ncbi:hypothetical protein FB566_3299 [Stackebrandtia endophytica]|uniref:Uncharacterized protein n=1 Tax=Stackebrandtia endophytica TaxID=1496996 RepID=A0A543AYT9_9ACTN|nr:hypothetical protein FB566_3299 [Stackebrandtia endophytica]